MGISPCLQITMLLAWGHMAKCMAESGLKPRSPEAHVDIFQNTGLLISLIPKILFLKKKKKKTFKEVLFPSTRACAFSGPGPRLAAGFCVPLRPRHSLALIPLATQPAGEREALPRGWG